MATNLVGRCNGHVKLRGTLSGGRTAVDPFPDECPCCAPPSVLVDVGNFWTHIKLTDDGQELKWFGDRGATGINAVMDPSKTHLYLTKDSGGTQGYESKSIWKVDLDCNIVWSEASSFLPQFDGGALVVLSNGDVICHNSGGGATIPDVIRRASTDGAEVWRETFNLPPVISTCADADDNIYLTRQAGNLQKLDSSGNSLWEVDIPQPSIFIGVALRGVATDADQLYVVGSGMINAGTSIHAYDLDGTFVWDANFAASLNCVAVRPNGDIVAAGTTNANGGSPSGFYTTFCFDSGGSLIWAADHGDIVKGICSDASNNVYTTGQYGSDKVTTRKYDPDGVLLWSHDYTYGEAVVFGAQSIVADDAGHVYVSGRWVQRFNLIATP